MLEGFLNVYSTSASRLPLHFARERVSLHTLAPHPTVDAVTYCSMLACLVGVGNVLCCSEYASISARFCVTLSNLQIQVWAHDVLLPMSSYPRNRGGFCSCCCCFIVFHQCPKGTRLYCPSSRSFREIEQKDPGGCCSLLQSYPGRGLSQNLTPPFLILL